MKDKCCRCQRETSKTYQLWEVEPMSVPMCKSCQEETIPERARQAKRDNLAKARERMKELIAIGKNLHPKE